MADLFDPLVIRSVTFRNRLGVSPMCMYCSEDGRATDWHWVHLGSRAVGGYGLVMMEATAVEATGRITPDDAGLWCDEQIEPLTRITRFISQYGGVPGIQLAHAGRKASTRRPWGHPNAKRALPVEEGGWPVVAPSPIPVDERYPTPRELDVAEIESIQNAFAEAAGRALHAGFSVLELHAAHGYLINEFLSPLTNHRSDEYGGSFDGRIRFLIEIVQKVRAVWPSRLPLFVRLSCTDWADERGGWRLHDSVELARRLKPLGVDLIDCSSGWVVSRVHVPFAPGFQVPFAAAIRRETGMLTAAVGVITDPHQAQRIIADGQADIVFTAREALRNPYFPIHAAHALQQPRAVPVPPQYALAWEGH